MRPNTGFVRKGAGSGFKTALELARSFPVGMLASRVCPYCYNTGYSSPGTRVKTHVICNHADTKEVRSGVTYRNLSITDTSFINWIFPQAEGFDVLHTFIPRWGMCVVDAGAL